MVKGDGLSGDIEADMRDIGAQSSFFDLDAGDSVTDASSDFNDDLE